MMTDPLMWSPIHLGRWFGVQVRLHIFLVLFLVFELLNASMTEGSPVVPTACWLALLLLTLALHELGHAAMATWLRGDPDDVRLWPLGNMIGPSSHGSRSADNISVALAGPAVNAAVVMITSLGLGLAFGAQFVWNPLGNGQGSGAPQMPNGSPAPALSVPWFIGWFGYLNWVLLLANLIPALPFDGGRVLRSFLASSSVSPAKDVLYAPMTAHVCATLLGLAGLVRLLGGKSDGITFISLALLIELMVRTEARILEDGGFFEDGIFGYDFSEGYTSLESSAAKVRPYRESALKRWRRRRSELRRKRRLAREAAEERRMDEILEKLHREGRSALTDEEHRFLVRVSTKYRNRPKARD